MTESSPPIGVEICKLFGFDPKITKEVTIKFSSTDAVIITAEIYPNEYDLVKLVSLCETLTVTHRMERIE